MESENLKWTKAQWGDCLAASHKPSMVWVTSELPSSKANCPADCMTNTHFFLLPEACRDLAASQSKACEVQMNSANKLFNWKKKKKEKTNCTAEAWLVTRAWWATYQGQHGAVTFRLYLLTVGRDDDALQLSEPQMFEHLSQPQHKPAFGLGLDGIFLVHTVLETDQLFQQIHNTGINFFTEHLAAVTKRNIRCHQLSTGCATAVLLPSHLRLEREMAWPPQEITLWWAILIKSGVSDRLDLTEVKDQSTFPLCHLQSIKPLCPTLHHGLLSDSCMSAIPHAPSLVKTSGESALEEKWEGRGQSFLRNHAEKSNNAMEPRCHLLSLITHSPQPKIWIYGHFCHHVSRTRDLKEADSMTLTCSITRSWPPSPGEWKPWAQPPG